MTTAAITTRRRFITGFDTEDRELEMVFDVTLSEKHTRKAEITDVPTELGVSMTDHMYMAPNKLTIEIGVSDTPLIYDGQGTPSWQLATTFTGSGRRTVTAFEALTKLQELGVPFNYQSGLQLYQNMMIESIDVPQEAPDDYELVATVTMKQVTFAVAESIVYPPRAPKKARPKKTQNVVRAEYPEAKETAKVKSSVLFDNTVGN